MKPKHKVGRPTDYNLGLAKEICDAIASNSVGIKQLCKENLNWPRARHQLSHTIVAAK